MRGGVQKSYHPHVSAMDSVALSGKLGPWATSMKCATVVVGLSSCTLYAYPIRLEWPTGRDCAASAGCLCYHAASLRFRRQ